MGLKILNLESCSFLSSKKKLKIWHTGGKEFFLQFWKKWSCVPISFWKAHLTSSKTILLWFSLSESNIHVLRNSARTAVSAKIAHLMFTQALLLPGHPGEHHGEWRRHPDEQDQDEHTHADHPEVYGLSVFLRYLKETNRRRDKIYKETTTSNFSSNSCRIDSRIEFIQEW